MAIKVTKIEFFGPNAAIIHVVDDCVERYCRVNARTEFVINGKTCNFLDAMHFLRNTSLFDILGITWYLNRCYNLVAALVRLYTRDYEGLESISTTEKTSTKRSSISIKKIIFNAPATIVFWTDGTKTVVRCGSVDVYDKEKGVFAACAKKLLGTNKTGSNYLNAIEKATREEWLCDEQDRH